MAVKVIALGSIGTVIESSDMQRRAYNKAIAEAGFDWDWHPELYSELLEVPGGKRRVRDYAAEVGNEITEEQVEAIHSGKSRIYQEMLREEGIALRDGIAEVIQKAQENGIQLVWTAGTSLENLQAIVDATDDIFTFDTFVYYTHHGLLTNRKPHPETYHMVMEKLNLKPDEILAIEDTESSLLSPVNAGVRVVATPGALTSDQDFSQATEVARDGEIADLDWLKSLMEEPAPAPIA
ncbi:MAG: HAD-IA family hydrolase [Chloroflexota bacterium]